MDKKTVRISQEDDEVEGIKFDNAMTLLSNASTLMNAFAESLDVDSLEPSPDDSKSTLN